MTPAGTTNELDVRNKWEHTRTVYLVDSCRVHTGSDRRLIGRTFRRRKVSSERTLMFEACDVAYARFLENHVQGLEEELRQRDHSGLVNNTRKVRLK